MKKCRLWIILGLLMLFGITNVEAASFNMSASKTKVTPNGTFTISVGGDCIGRVNLSITGGTLSTTSVWVEQNYQTITVKAGSSGTVTIVATPAAGFSDADANEYAPGARSIKVAIGSGSTSSGNTTTKPPADTRSTNNLLASLTINSGALSPAFDANTLEYHVDLPSSQKSLVINAKPADGKASVTGTGEVNLNPGDNTMKVTVTAENGAVKEYVIYAYVEEEPDVYLSYKEEEIGVVKNLKGVTLTGFETKQHTINDHAFTLFSNGNLTFIYGINSKNEKGFYLFDEELSECTSKIHPLTVQNKTFYLYDLEKNRAGFTKTKININNVEVEGYQFEKGFEHYFLIPVFNSEGKEVDYLYEDTEQTFQLYSNFLSITEKETQNLKKEMKQKEGIIYGLIACFIASLGGIVFLFIKNKRGKKDEKKH